MPAALTSETKSRAEWRSERQWSLGGRVRDASHPQISGHHPRGSSSAPPVAPATSRCLLGGVASAALDAASVVLVCVGSRAVSSAPARGAAARRRARAAEPSRRTEPNKPPPPAPRRRRAGRAASRRSFPRAAATAPPRRAGAERRHRPAGGPAPRGGGGYRRARRRQGCPVGGCAGLDAASARRWSPTVGEGPERLRRGLRTRAERLRKEAAPRPWSGSGSALARALSAPGARPEHGDAQRRRAQEEARPGPLSGATPSGGWLGAGGGLRVGERPGSHALESWGRPARAGQNVAQLEEARRARVCSKSPPLAGHGCAWRRMARRVKRRGRRRRAEPSWSTPDAMTVEMARVASASTSYSAPGSKPQPLSPPGRWCRPRRHRTAPRPGAGRGRVGSWLKSRRLLRGSTALRAAARPFTRAA